MLVWGVGFDAGVECVGIGVASVGGYRCGCRV